MAAQVQAMMGWDEVAGEWYTNPEGQYEAKNPEAVEFQVGVFGQDQAFAVVYGNASKSMCRSLKNLPVTVSDRIRCAVAGAALRVVIYGPSVPVPKNRGLYAAGGNRHGQSTAASPSGCMTF